MTRVLGVISPMPLLPMSRIVQLVSGLVTTNFGWPSMPFMGMPMARACMLKCHPLYLLGFGLEDLETCKCVFSASNSVACLVQHSVGEVRSGLVPGHFCQTGDWTVGSPTQFLGPGPGLPGMVYNGLVPVQTGSRLGLAHLCTPSSPHLTQYHSLCCWSSLVLPRPDLITDHKS